MNTMTLELPFDLVAEAGSRPAVRPGGRGVVQRMFAEPRVSLILRERHADRCAIRRVFAAPIVVPHDHQHPRCFVSCDGDR